MLDLFKGANKLGLTFSVKGSFVTSHDSILKSLGKELTGLGISMVASASARDVGADFAAGKAHTFARRSILKKRLTSGKVRVKKVIGLAKVNRSARRLFVAFVFTQKTFAHQIPGILCLRF